MPASWRTNHQRFAARQRNGGYPAYSGSSVRQPLPGSRLPVAVGMPAVLVGPGDVVSADGTPVRISEVGADAA